MSNSETLLLLFIPGFCFYGGGLLWKVLEFGNPFLIVPFDFLETSFVFTPGSFAYLFILVQYLLWCER